MKERHKRSVTLDRKMSSLRAGTSKTLQTTCCLTATVSPSSTPNRVPGAPGPTLPADFPVGARRAWFDPRSKPLSTAWPATGAASVTGSTRSFFSSAEAMAPIPVLRLAEFHSLAKEYSNSKKCCPD